jgi:biotin-dependent carboxylase-like uncharacterized protein
MINVNKPGLLTTVQDSGRPGYYEIGMPPSGAMDDFSFRVANLLVGNDENAAALESTYMGPELAFAEETLFAITGADMPAKLNGQPIPAWEAVAARAGDVLSFGFIRTGARCYIAVAGGFDVPTVLGSRSTYPLCGMGGYQGRALRQGDQLATCATSGAQVQRAGTRLDSRFIPTLSNEAEIRAVMGLCAYRLTEASKQSFLETVWTVTPEADRIGYRLRGGRLDFVPREQPFGAGSNPSNVVDLGYPIGSIQVPDGVEPIVLLNDAVTGGGYATIGTVISVDRCRLAQTKTHDKVKFTPVSLEEALAARKAYKERLAVVRASLATR